MGGDTSMAMVSKSFADLAHWGQLNQQHQLQQSHLGYEGAARQEEMTRNLPTEDPQRQAALAALQRYGRGYFGRTFSIPTQEVGGTPATPAQAITSPAGEARAEGVSRTTTVPGTPGTPGTKQFYMPGYDTADPKVLEHVNSTITQFRNAINMARHPVTGEIDEAQRNSVVTQAKAWTGQMQKYLGPNWNKYSTMFPNWEQMASEMTSAEKTAGAAKQAMTDRKTWETGLHDASLAYRMALTTGSPFGITRALDDLNHVIGAGQAAKYTAQSPYDIHKELQDWFWHQDHIRAWQIADEMKSTYGIDLSPAQKKLISEDERIREKRAQPKVTPVNMPVPTKIEDLVGEYRDLHARIDAAEIDPMAKPDPAKNQQYRQRLALIEGALRSPENQKQIQQQITVIQNQITQVNVDLTSATRAEQAKIRATRLLPLQQQLAQYQKILGLGGNKPAGGQPAPAGPKYTPPAGAQHGTYKGQPAWQLADGSIVDEQGQPIK